MKDGIVVLLNGTSSSGKSTLAKTLQGVLDKPFLHLDGDYFWQMYPERFFAGKPDELYRPWRGRFLPASYLSIATLVKSGLNVIVDEVLTKPMTLTWLQAALADSEVVFVGLYCGLAELERRESKRGDRKIGLARFQYPNIHIHGEYDIEVNTENNDVVACAQQIKERLESRPGFDQFHLVKEQPLPV